MQSKQSKAVYNIFPVNLIYTQGREKPEKRPAVSGWQSHHATADELSHWSNIGAGIPSGHVVIDLDTYKGVTRADVDAALGVTLDWDAAAVQTTVTGGEHYCFKLPEGAWVGQGSSLLGVAGFDTRTHGKGWICTGQGYEDLTIYGMPEVLFIEDWPLLPLEAAERLRVAGLGDDGTGGDKKPLGYTLDQLKQMLATLDPATDRDEWLKVGMALHHETEGSKAGWALFRNWSGSKGADGQYIYSKYNVEDVRKAWASFKRKSGGTVTARTLRMLAAEKGVDIEPESITVEDFDAFPCETLPNGGVRKELAFKRDKKGKIEAVIGNVYAAVASVEFCGLEVRCDQFRDEIVYRKQDGEGWVPFKDTNYTDLRIELERKGFKPVTRDMIRDVVKAVAHDHTFDLAIEWINGLEWDGTPRIATYFERYFGVEASEYTTAVSLYIWTAMAGRVLVPGIKADMVPILAGPQGVGKSRGVAAMSPSPEFFVEISLSESDVDLARKQRGSLVIEIGELRGLHTKELESIKAFVTRTHEKWIPKYQEFATTFARRSVFLGTTNETEFLADETGNRRWLPLNVTNVDVEGIERDRLQLWAEAREMFKVSGVSYQIPTSLTGVVHDAHSIDDDWKDVIDEWLDKTDLLTGEVNRHKRYITSAYVLTDALGFDIKHIGRREQVRIAKVLRALGFEKDVGKENGKSVKCWRYCPF